MKWRVRVLASMVLAVIIAWPRFAVAAPDGIYLTHAASVTQNSTIDVQVRTNSSLAVNVVQSNLSYNASMLEYIGTSTAGSKYELGVEESGGNGVVRIARATFAAVAGDHLVATITFKALVGSGSMQFTFEGGTAMADGTNTVTTSHPSSINFLGAVTSPAQPTAKPSSKPTVKPVPAPAPSEPSADTDTTPPEISSVSITEVTSLSAKISWRTNEPTTGEVAYGGDETYGMAVESGELKTEHTVSLDPNNLQPLTLYNIKITAIDATGNETAHQNQTVTTLGAPVLIRVVDHTNTPIASAVVTISGFTKTTNEQGETTYALGLGPHDLQVTYGNLKRTERFTVMAQKTEQETQLFIMTIKTPSQSPVVSISLGLGAIAGLATGVFLLIKFTHRKHVPYDSSANSYINPKSI